jgi:glycyl-tRNA synthetase beta chain
MSAPADLLVEVGTEELPPKALRQLRDAFADGMTKGLADARLAHGDVSAFASPRRLAVVVAAVADAQDDREVVQKGPPVHIAFDDDRQPTRAAQAFADKCGVSIDELDREKSDAGEWLSFTSTEKGQSVGELLPGIVQRSLDALPVPRRMRWGARDDEFVRPVHWLIMLHGDDVIPGSVLGIESGRLTEGHRFHTSEKITVAAAANYDDALGKEGYVIADFDKRRQKIVEGVADAASRAGGVPVGDDALYDEVAALTEWPIPMAGSFDEEYLALPDEVIVATLTNHQRYFPVADTDGRLKPVFVTVANLESLAPDRVRDGNERVIRPRLADAAFFWETDRNTRLGDRMGALAQVVYQKGLGTLHDKSVRVAALSQLFADQLGADGETVTRAAVLAKCDLLTGMVGEFPELQGTMGGYYAEASGEPEAVATAIAEQYLPRFAGDALPASSAGRLLAIADKLDTLAGIFVLGKRPTGNRDPFGLRRAALGVIRIVVEHSLDIDIVEAINAAIVQQPSAGEDHGETRDQLYEFIMDRLRRYLLDAGQQYSADMFEAVRVKRPSSLVDFRERLDAVARFIELEPATRLAAANKRTANILRQAGYDGTEAGSDAFDESLLQEAAEKNLFEAIERARKDVDPLLGERAYADSLARLAELRAPVDAFFDDVMVMTDDEALRANRLSLLKRLRDLFLNVADISRLTPAQE